MAVRLSTEDVPRLLCTFLQLHGLQTLRDIRLAFQLPDDWDGELVETISNEMLTITLTLSRARDNVPPHGGCASKVPDKPREDALRGGVEHDIVAVFRSLQSGPFRRFTSDEIQRHMRAQRKDYSEKSIQQTLTSLRKRGILHNDNDKTGYYLDPLWLQPEDNPGTTTAPRGGNGGPT